MILEAGTFRVADYRKAIPDWVKVQVIINGWLAFVHCATFNPERIDDTLTDARNIQFDHDPALCDRPYDTVAGDFIPPQNDPNHILALGKPKHLQKTTGRVAGAAVTVTTRGSDVGERSRTSDIRASQAVHRARLAAKAGRPGEATKILADARLKKKHVRPKAKIARRAGPWPQRKMRG